MLIQRKRFGFGDECKNAKNSCIANKREREREQMIGRSNERKRERRGKVENNEVEFEIIQ